MKKTLKVVLNMCLCVSLTVSGCALPKKIDAKTNTSNNNSYLSKRKELKEERTEYSTTYQVGNGKKQIEMVWLRKILQQRRPEKLQTAIRSCLINRRM